MREIKFRARNAGVPSCWIYGYFAIIEDRCCIFNKDGKFPVIAGTECQYIGRKDKNGKEMYAGDILRGIFYDNKPSIIEIKWSDKLGLTVGGYPPYIHGLHSIEIIGNKLENPELLRG